MGSRAGLPFTFVWADSQFLQNPSTAGHALGDPALWANPAAGVNQQPAIPLVVGTASPAMHQMTARFDPTKLNYFGLLGTNTSPSYNFTDGCLEHAQMLQGTGLGRNGAVSQNAFMQVVAITKTETGRFNAQGDIANNYLGGVKLPKPANHTWHQFRQDAVDELARPSLTESAFLPSYDMSIGSQTDSTTTPADAASTVFSHKSDLCLPSNGLGATYGDNHNIRYATNLWSCAVELSAGGGMPPLDPSLDDSTSMACHWGINVMSMERAPKWGSFNDGDVNTKLMSQPDGHGKGPQQYVYPQETIQVIGVDDQPSGTIVPSSPLIWRPLGRADLGNLCVSHSVGLVGYEGLITATAFMKVSETANTPQMQGAIPPATAYVDTDKGTFAGINIQVHSGSSVRRNGPAFGEGVNEEAYAYTGAGAPALLEPIQEALQTTGNWTNWNGTTYPQTASQTVNQSRFYTGRTQHASVFRTPLAFAVPTASAPIGPASGAFMEKQSPANGYIVGDKATGQVPWTGTIEMSQDFMKDRIPTKVQVIPSLVGYETVTVSGAGHPSGTSIKYRKPIVDYHVLVSLAPRTRLQIEANLTRSNMGQPYLRDSPVPNRNSVQLDLEDEGCEIMHAVFRLNPTLSRIQIVNTLLVNTPADQACEKSVLPTNWGLHQLTPFRPIANKSWAKIPLLSGAIEAGGFYQKGGISHHWSADAYGGELFLAVDVIEMAHLNASIYGAGQYKADGNQTAEVPDGCELLIFKYDPATDPWYSPSVNVNHLSNNITEATPTTTIQSGITFTPKENTLKTEYKGWDFHDWVFPQIELMRYVGRESKFDMKHPRHSGNTGNSPMFHPTLHCGDLSIMEDGRMVMAAIHRDYIGSEEEYPSNAVGYPYNPDAGSGAGCPAGYYYSNGQCIPITGGDAPPSSEDTHYDPITGEVVQGPNPAPSTGSGTGYAGGGDNFSPWPSWSRIVANTSARSLIVMWSEAKAKDGKLHGSKTVFDYRASEAGGNTIHSQNWVSEDNWWSGSRLAYWFQESGQRAIPMTYGSYPEGRMAFPNLPKSLPYIGTGGKITSGYPMIQPVVNDLVRGFNSSGVEYNLVTAINAQNIPDLTNHYLKLSMSHFVPTTVGFCDYGMSANPWQEFGRSGWSFPRGLYDPIGYGNNTLFFSDSPEATVVPFGTAIVPTQQAIWAGFGSSGTYGPYMKGTMSILSHHGPLHYGIMSKDHPFRPDRIWKQIHAGMGYDIPLHLIAPPRVSVRAKAGGRNSIDLEMETPFHRQESNRLTGPRRVNPSATNVGGQFFLRTNLWNAKQPDLPAGQATHPTSIGIISTDRIRGPLVEGIAGQDLTAFWSDHPNDHFHAGAIPIMTGSDYDYNTIENERYAPAVIARSQEMSKHDYIAMAEQLQSSVDVHVSSAVRPIWDSGGIISSRGSGLRDSAMSTHTPNIRQSMNGQPVPTSSTIMTGLGQGQRILRTPDGALHSFSLDRSGKAGMLNAPVWTHYTKPLHNDLFWNRKAMKVNPSASPTSGADEVQPHLLNLESSLGTQTTHGAAFASDSEGTIHAIVEVKDSSGIHHLYYTYAKRTQGLMSSQPYPVYSWNWAVDTLGQAIPFVKIESASITDGGWDLRQPTLACDSKDRLHLAFRLVGRASAYQATQAPIVYCTKLKEENNWPVLPTQLPNLAEGLQANGSWSIVNKQVITAIASDNIATAKSGHASQHNDNPKICLLGDDTPVVFFRGQSFDTAGTDQDYATVWGERAKAAVYVNVGTSPSLTAPQGRFLFDSEKSTMALGNIGCSSITSNVGWYDAVIDSDNRAYITAIKDDEVRSTFINSFAADTKLSEQYTTANGLVKTMALFTANTTERPDYGDITMTISDKGQLHMIISFTQAVSTGDMNNLVGATIQPNIKESAAGSLQWAGTPPNPTTGQYELPAAGVTEWPTGGSNPSLMGNRKHFMEVWMPTIEVSQDAGEADHIIRSINVRWLSVPSMGYDATTGWYPVGSAQSLNGHEDFVHTAPQLRFQQFHGFNNGELDLRWTTNELSWMNTPHQGSKLYYPYIGGATMAVGEGSTTGEGIAGWP
tara:strand:- start:2002 stop:8190 length:6189 start_codon:yes stop_codon:yes gene_type:complete